MPADGPDTSRGSTNREHRQLSLEAQGHQAWQSHRWRTPRHDEAAHAGNSLPTRGGVLPICTLDQLMRVPGCSQLSSGFGISRMHMHPVFLQEKLRNFTSEVLSHLAEPICADSMEPTEAVSNPCVFLTKECVRVGEAWAVLTDLVRVGEGPCPPHGRRSPAMRHVCMMGVSCGHAESRSCRGSVL